MLWYLVIPPFVVVLSLGALLWVFSRGAGSEEVSRNLSLAEAEAMSGSRSRALSRKAFFLKLAEKTASRFKTSTLRVHNFFQDSLEKLRRKRNEIDAIRKHMDAEEEQGETVSTEGKKVSEEPRRRFGGMFGRGSDGEKGVAENAVPQEVGRMTVEPVSPKRSGVFGRRSEAGYSGSDGEALPEPRPMLRREVVRPELNPVRTEKDPHEVELLSRIVENPRDISAYEELGDWYFSGGNMEDAKECYRQALKLHPTNRAVKIKIRKLERFFEKRNG